MAETQVLGRGNRIGVSGSFWLKKSPRPDFLSELRGSNGLALQRGLRLDGTMEARSVRAPTSGKH